MGRRWAPFDSQRFLFSIDAGSRNSENAMIRVRPYVFADREFLVSLAPRPAVGIVPWRDTQRMTMTAEKWISGSIGQHCEKSMIVVTER
jgi:hypothetical protein